MHGDGAGNYIESFCSPGNTKTLKIRATTNLANDPATNVNPDFPAIMLQTYDKTALTVDNTANVGVGTTELSVLVRAKLHTASGTTENPAAPGSAFVMFEGNPTTGKVIVAHDSIGATTWSKVTSNFTEGWSNPGLVVSTPGGTRTLTIVNGLITGIV